MIRGGWNDVVAFGSVSATMSIDCNSNAMELEIERKWFVAALPDLSQLRPWHDERYYLYSDEHRSIRFQKRETFFEIERMESVSSLSRKQEKLLITEAEFEALKKIAKGPLDRNSYLLQNEPQLTLKLYHGPFHGLIRAEVEFTSEEQAKAFISLPWFAHEIDPQCPLGRDSVLVNLTDTEFNALLLEYRVPLLRY